VLIKAGTSTRGDPTSWPSRSRAFEVDEQNDRMVLAGATRDSETLPQAYGCDAHSGGNEAWRIG
jgi:hypothetical protein